MLRLRLPAFSGFLYLLLLAACAAAQPQRLEYQVLERYPHNPTFFTQGLLFYQGQLYESTGQYGASQLIRYAGDFSTPLVRRPLAPSYFGEGIAVLNERLYQLTWREEEALIYHPGTLQQIDSFRYQGEGWGLTSDEENLWMTNGSSRLIKLNSAGQILGQVEVRLADRPLDRLNELEYINGLIAANRWFDNNIYFIEPNSGEVKALLDLSDLAAPELRRSRDNVLNGVAWHPERQTLFFTGKNWTLLYELEVPWLK